MIVSVKAKTYSDKMSHQYRRVLDLIFKRCVKCDITQNGLSNPVFFPHSTRVLPLVPTLLSFSKFFWRCCVHFPRILRNYDERLQASPAALRRCLVQLRPTHHASGFYLTSL